jgi:hypothetical protein
VNWRYGCRLSLCASGSKSRLQFHSAQRRSAGGLLQNFEEIFLSSFCRRRFSLSAEAKARTRAETLTAEEVYGVTRFSASVSQKIARN